MKVSFTPIDGDDRFNSLDEKVLNEKIGLAIANLLTWTMEWRQGPGEFGGLYLHPCWGETGVLGRGYQGVTVSNYYSLIPVFLDLYGKTGETSFFKEALAMLNLLERLQLADGCFDHSLYEGEPGRGTVVHNALADLGLLYMAEKTESTEIRERILRIVRKNFEWLNSYWWHRGNAWKIGVDYPAWCAVTNQDLSVAYAMLRYGELSEETRYLNHYGRPVVSWIMENAYYPNVGMFFRGDTPDFFERVPYCGLIDFLLLKLNLHLKDNSITEAVLRNLDEILKHSWRDKYGCLRFPGSFDFSGKLENKASNVLDLVNFICTFDLLTNRYGIRRYDGVRNDILHTVMFYQSEFGGIESDGGRGDIIDLVPLPGNFGALALLVSLWNGSTLPEVSRPNLSLTVSREQLWAEDRETWLIFGKGQIYSGVKKLPNGIYRDNRVRGLKNISFEERQVKIFFNENFKGSWINVGQVETTMPVAIEGAKRSIKVTYRRTA